MKKTIKITEEQKQRLGEMLFQGGDDNPSPLKQYHNSQVVADGYVDDTDGGGEPITGDKFGKMLCKNYPYGTAYYHTAYARPLGESEISDLYNNEDSNDDGVKDTYNHADSNYEDFGDLAAYHSSRIVLKMLDNL